ncbi:hypothetical protein [Yersinia enterocolitica]|nr:hypothetical protein [Yersinia enterocolitica]
MKLQQSVVCTGMALDRGGIGYIQSLYKGGALQDHRFYQVASPGRWDV